MFNFLFRTPKKKEETSDLGVSVEIEEKAKSAKELFDDAVKDTLLRNLRDPVKIQIAKLVLGEECYEQTKAAHEHYYSVPLTERSIAETLKLFPKAKNRTSRSSFTCYDPDYSFVHWVTLDDLVTWLSGQIADQILEAEKGE